MAHRSPGSPNENEIPPRTRKGGRRSDRVENEAKRSEAQALAHENALKELRLEEEMPWELESRGSGTGKTGRHKGMLVLTAIVAIVLLVAAGGYFVTLDPASPPSQNLVVAQPTASPASEIEDIKEALSNAMKAATVEDLAEFVRHPERTLPRATRYYSRREWKPRTVTHFFNNARDIVVDETEFTSITIELDHSNLHLALLEKVAGLWLLDWESFVGYSETSWSDFLEKKPEGAYQFRVIAERSDYYNYDFGDPKKYLCLRLADADETDFCWGYAARSTLAAKKISERMDARGGAPLRMILKLRFPRTSQVEKNQVSIDEVIVSGWLQ